MKRLFAFYINSSIHVALAVGALVELTFLQLDLSRDFNLVCFAFFGTITGYNFVKYAAVAKLYHRRLTTALRLIQVFSLLSVVAMFFYVWQLPRVSLYWIGFLFLITMCYVWPFYAGKTLRTLPGIKIFVIAACWTGATVFLPVLQDASDWDWDVWRIVLQRFLLVLVLMIPFEIRDLNYDNQALRTWPQQFGIPRVKGIGMVLLLGVVALTIFRRNTHAGETYSLLLIAGLASFLLSKSSKEQPQYYASFWVESIPILWFLMHIAGDYLFG